MEERETPEIKMNERLKEKKKNQKKNPLGKAPKNDGLPSPDPRFLRRVGWKKNYFVKSRTETFSYILTQLIYEIKIYNWKANKIDGRYISTR